MTPPDDSPIRNPDEIRQDAARKLRVVQVSEHNFKSEIARHQERAGAAYEHSLHEVWSVMNRLQK